MIEANFLAPPQGPGEIGQLGLYRVRRALRAGHAGIVFEAEDPQVHSAVALQVLPPEHAADAGRKPLILAAASERTATTGDRVLLLNLAMIGDARDWRDDLFGLGWLLYRMATGVAPFANVTMPAIVRTAELPPPKRYPLLGCRHAGTTRRAARSIRQGAGVRRRERHATVGDRHRSTRSYWPA